MTAEKFNKKASIPKNKPDEIINKLKIQKGQHIADIGSGGGYFTYRFATLVGNKGKVYALDTNQELLTFIKDESQKKSLQNVETILIPKDSIVLPEESVDLIFMRNVYHHLENRVEYTKKLKTLLKPNGTIAIIEYKKQGGLHSFHRPFGHYVRPEIIIAEMETAGYRVEEQYFFLPEQSMTIFSLPKSDINKKAEG